MSSLDWYDRPLPASEFAAPRLVRTGACLVGAETAADGDGWPPAEAMPLLPRRARETARAARPAVARPDLGLLQQVLNALKSLD